MIYKVYGPPGTGKTTKLLNFVKFYTDEGIPLHKIGYFAFTKKAAKEAQEQIKILSNSSFICFSFIGFKRRECNAALSLRRFR